MLKDKFIKITIYKNSKNKNYYKDKGYNILDNTKINLKVEDLQKSSTFKICAICDICGKENIIEYRHYLINIEKYNYYSCHGKCSREKNKRTNIDRYSVENPAQIKDVQEKMKKTNLKKYGCENPFQNKEIKEKIKKSNIIIYGAENPNQNKKVRDKNKKTCLLKYGVEHPMQNQEIFEKNQKNCYSIEKHKETGLNYRSTYERHFLDFCIERKINIKKGKRISYMFENKEHYYFSDFFIEEINLIIEIKSAWTYSNDIEKNIVKKEFTLKSGYNFLFLIDKNYEDLLKII